MAAWNKPLSGGGGAVVGRLQPGVNVCEIWAGNSQLGEVVSSFLRLECNQELLLNQKLERNFLSFPHTHLHQVPTWGPHFTSTFVEKVETEIIIVMHEALTSNSG